MSTTETVTITLDDTCSCCEGCPHCSHCSFAFAAINSNNCTDDPFDVFLNGVLIASFPERDDSCLCPDPMGVRGNIVSGGTLPCDADDLVGTPPGNMLVHTSAALDNVTACSMVFRMVSTGDNNCANFGDIRAYKICRDEGVIVSCCLIYLDTYSSDLNVPVDQTYTVANPCCPPPMGLRAVSNTVPKAKKLVPKKATPKPKNAVCDCNKKVKKPVKPEGWTVANYGKLTQWKPI